MGQLAAFNTAASKPQPKKRKASDSPTSSAPVIAVSSVPKAPVTRVFVACPADTMTGGPEALHQLCAKLSQFGMQSFMLYFNPKNKARLVESLGAATPEPYQHYGTDVAKIPPSGEGDLVIYPEAYTPFIDTYRASQKAIWWLSVDNNAGLYRTFVRGDIFHYCQSKYAFEHLRGKGVPMDNITMLTEFIPRTRWPDERGAEGRDDVVLYNPAKGVHYTDLIRQRSEPNGVKFVPIKGLTPAGVTDLMLKSQVYIDFGSHPGMDRLPREAALAGLVVITNKEGAAKYTPDVPIPEEFKFRKFNEDKIHTALIGSLGKGWSNANAKFDEYRAWIKDQEAVMDLLISKMVDRLGNKDWREQHDETEVERLQIKVSKRA